MNDIDDFSLEYWDGYLTSRSTLPRSLLDGKMAISHT